MKHVLVGPSGGVIDAIAKKLLPQQPSLTVFHLSTEGISPYFSEYDLGAVNVQKGDILNKEILEKTLQGAETVIACADCGIEQEKIPINFDPDAILFRIVEAAPASVKKLVVLVPAGKYSKKSEGTRLFGGKDLMKTLESKKGCLKIVVSHGALFGQLPGKEPLPFMTGPKAVPVIEESYRKQGVLLSLTDTLARDGRTLRSSLAEAVVRFLERPLSDPSKQGDNVFSFSIVSVEDFAVPSDEAWGKELSRLDSSKGVQVYSVEFDKVQNLSGFLTWLELKWASNTLKKLPIVEKSRSGARPVSVSRLSNGISIVWETVDNDLRVVKAGKLQILINEDDPSLVVTRTDGAGSPLTAVLPGEEEIVQSLVEGLNSDAYPRGYVVKRKAEPAVGVSRALAAAVATAEGDSRNSLDETKAARPGRKRSSLKR